MDFLYLWLSLPAQCFTNFLALITFGMSLAVLSLHGWKQEQQMDIREEGGLGLFPLCVFL